MRNMKRRVWRIVLKSVWWMTCVSTCEAMNTKYCRVMLVCRMQPWLEPLNVITRCLLNVNVCYVHQQRVTLRLWIWIRVSVLWKLMYRLPLKEPCRGWWLPKRVLTVKQVATLVVSVMLRDRNVLMSVLPVSRRSKPGCIWCCYRSVKRMQLLLLLLRIMPRLLMKR